MPDSQLNLVNKTGFPLQIALARLVQANENTGWRVMYTEHSWRNARDESGGYADLVLENVVRDVVLILECKRIQEASYVFLHQGGKGDDVARVRSLRVQRVPNGAVEQAFPMWTDETCFRSQRRQRSASPAGRSAVPLWKQSPPS